jgi:hypothetical protein
MARAAGFGRVFHCEPVRSVSEAIKCYLSKYIVKHITQRMLVDRGRRLVAYFGRASSVRALPAANRFAYGGALTEVVNGKERPCYRNGWAWLYRAKAAKYFRRVHRLHDVAQVREVFGPKWAYSHRDAIHAEKLSHYPYMYLARLDGALESAVESVFASGGAFVCSDLVELDLCRGVSITSHSSRPPLERESPPAESLIVQRAFDRYFSVDRVSGDVGESEFALLIGDGPVRKSLYSVADAVA